MNRTRSLLAVRVLLLAGFAGLLLATVLAAGCSGAARPFGRSSPLVEAQSFRERTPLPGEAEELSSANGPDAQVVSSELHSTKCHLEGHPYLGITYLTVTEDVRRLHDLSGVGGALITAVERNSPADRAGLRPYDVIEEFDGVPVTITDTLVSLQMRHRAGDNVDLILLRQKARHKTNVTFASLGAN